MTLFLNIGSNLGNPRVNINRAIALIADLHWLDNETIRLSDYYESEPWGFQSDNKFVNIGLAVEIKGDKSPIEILHRLQAIELTINGSNGHRNEKNEYVDRLLDIDIIAIDDIVLNNPELTLPHPRMHLRDFVIIPMMSLASEWVHPLFKKKLKDLCR